MTTLGIYSNLYSKEYTNLFCRSLFVLLSFFSWSLCCLSFDDLQLLITSLLSSNSSYYCNYSFRQNQFFFYTSGFCWTFLLLSPMTTLGIYSYTLKNLLGFDELIQQCNSIVLLLFFVFTSNFLPLVIFAELSW